MMPSPKNPKKTVAIAGAGLAGLAAAVFFYLFWYQVTIFERKPICGGRAFSFIDKQTGLTIDNGQHLMMNAYQETLALLTKVGAKHKVESQIPTQVVIFDAEGNRGEFVLRPGLAPLHLLKAVFGFSLFFFFLKLSFLRLGWHLRRVQKNKITISEHLTVHDWLLQHGQTQRTITNFWEILTLATLNMSTQQAQARLLAEVLLRCYFAGPQDGFLVFPRAGLSEVVVQPILQYLGQRGHTVISHTGVKSIAILDEKVRCFVLDSGEKVKADLYIAALPPLSLQNTLPLSFWQNHEQLQNLPRFQDSPIVSVNLFYDQPVMDEVFVGGAITATHWFFNRNKIHHQTNAPFHVVAVISAGQNFLQQSKQQIIEQAQQDLQKLCPKAVEAKLLHALVNIERQATVVLDAQAANMRPDVKILDNFMVIGDWVKTGLPATLESAVLSAKLAAKQVGDC